MISRSQAGRSLKRHRGPQVVLRGDRIAGPLPHGIQVVTRRVLGRGVNSYADSAYYTHASGAGVFNAGTMRWVGAFTPYAYREFGVNRRGGDFVRRVTANVLRAFADGPAAAKYPARDNLDAMQEWAGDPIAAQHDLWPTVTR